MHFRSPALFPSFLINAILASACAPVPKAAFAPVGWPAFVVPQSRRRRKFKPSHQSHTLRRDR
jgi:hypothetical protein